MVKDINGCTGSETRTLDEPNAIVINTIATDATCFGGENGAIQVVASGGACTLAYSIDFGITYQSSNVFEDLGAGTYVVVVRDARGCLSNQTVRVTQPAKINISLGVLNVTCKNAEDGVIAVTAWGGTGALQYSLDGNNYQPSNVFSDLSGGAYIVHVKDANNCIEFQNTIVVEPALLKAVEAISNVSCAGGENGVIDLTVSGGTLPYSIIWFNGATTQDLTGLAAGNYSVTVEDANNCVTSNSFTVAGYTSVAELSLIKNSTSLYPNPASNFTVIEAVGFEINSVQVYGLTGRIVFESNPNTSKENINTANFTNGVYYVRIGVNNNFITKKLEIIQ